MTAIDLLSPSVVVITTVSGLRSSSPPCATWERSLSIQIDVPAEAIGYLAEQLDIKDTSSLKAYTDREMTRLGHAQEIQREYGVGNFVSVQSTLVR